MTVRRLNETVSKVNTIISKSIILCQFFKNFESSTKENNKIIYQYIIKDLNYRNMCKLVNDIIPLIKQDDLADELSQDNGVSDD